MPGLTFCVRLLLALSLLLPLSGLADTGLRADKTELAVGEATTVYLEGVSGLFKTRWKTSPEGLASISGSNKQATVTAVKPGTVTVIAKVLGDSYDLSLTILAAPDKPDKKAWHTKIEGMAKVMGLPDKYAKIARMLAEVNDGSRQAYEFYADLAKLGATMFDVIAVRSKLVDGDPAFARDVLGKTFAGGGTDVEMNLLGWRRKQTLAAIDEVVKRFVDAGRIPKDGFSLIVSHVGKWASQELSALTFTGDIDFSFVCNDTELAQAMKDAYAEVIRKRTGLDPKSLDSVATAHGKAGLEVYIGRHGMAFAEEQLKINQLVDMNTGAKREISFEDVTLGLSMERAMAETFGKEPTRPVHDTEPGLSMEMVRHFGHDIVKPAIYDLTNSVVKAAKYLDRSYKSLAAAKGTPADPELAAFAKQITAWANTKPQTAEVRDNMIKKISDTLGSPPKVVFDEGTQKLVLSLDAGQIDAFHEKATQAMWQTVEQSSTARTRALEEKMQELTERKRRGDNVNEEVAKLRKDMTNLVDMVEAEIKAFGEIKVPPVVVENNARVRALLNILAGRFGTKVLSEEELKDKKFVEELLKAEGESGSEHRRQLTAAYIMERGVDALVRSPELAMTGVEKTNQMLDYIDDKLLGSIRGETGFADFETELARIRSLAADPKTRPGLGREISNLKNMVALGIKTTNQKINEKLQATSAGRQGMKFMMVYGLADEMKSYRDAFNNEGWTGFATEIFRRRIPLGSAVEGAVMGNTYRAAWDVVTTLIPPLALPEAAAGLGTMIGTQAKTMYWNEQLSLFVDSLYDGAKFQLEEVEDHKGAKVGVYRLKSVKHRGITIDLAQFAAMRKEQVEAIRQQIGRGHLDWGTYKSEFTGLTNWLDVDQMLQKTIADNDPALALIEEMVKHENVGPKLLDRLAEKGVVRWEEVKLNFITTLIKRLEDRKQADQALGAGMLPDLFQQLRQTAAELEIERAMLKQLDAEVDTNNLKALINWLWETKRTVLGQAPTENETTRAAQVVKKYLDTYKGILRSRDGILAGLPSAVGNDGSSRYLTGDLFLSGRAEADKDRAASWVKHAGTALNAGKEALLAIKKVYLPAVGLDDQDQKFLARLYPHELWVKPYRDAGVSQEKSDLVNRAVAHGKAKKDILAEYKAWLEKQAPVQLTVTLVDASGGGKQVANARGWLTPEDKTAKSANASGSGRLVFGVASGRYNLGVEAPGFANASKYLVLGRNLDPAPKITLSMKPTDKPDDKKPGDEPKPGEDGKPDGALPGGDGSGLAGTDRPKPTDLKNVTCGNPTGTFDKEPFNGLQLRYGISGLCVGPNKDSEGFTHSRSFEILGITGDSITVSGSSAPREAPCHSWAGSFWFQTDVTLSVGGQSKTWSSPKPCERKSDTQYNVSQPAYAFNLSLPVPRDKTEIPVSVSVRQTYVNPRFGDRGLVVSGSGIHVREVIGSFPQGGKDGVPPPPALLVSLEGPKEAVRYGVPINFNAKVEGGKPPYGYAWSGATGSGLQAQATPKKPGELTVEVTASDAAGQTAKASLKVKVEAPKLALTGLPGQPVYGSSARLTIAGLPGVTPAADPCGGRSYTGGSNPYDECARVSNVKTVASGNSGLAAPQISGGGSGGGSTAAPRYRFVWQSSPALTFEPASSEDGATSVTFDRMGEVKVWCEVLVEDEGAWVTLAETEQQTIKVVAPRFELRFEPADGLGLIGQPVRANLVATPEVPSNLIDYRWFEPPSSNRMEYGQPAAEIGFTPRDGKALKLDVLARAPHHGDEIAKINGSYTARPYTVKVVALEPPNRPMIWDPAKGGLKPVPKDTWLTDERITLRAELAGGPPPASLRWRWKVNEGSSIGNDISQTPTVGRHEPGSLAATVEALDGDGNVLGSGNHSLEVVAPPVDPTKGKEPVKPGDKPGTTSGSAPNEMRAPDGSVWMSRDTRDGMYRQEARGNELKVSRQGNNPGGVQNSGRKMRLDQPVAGDFEARVGFANARISGGLNQVELQASFADGASFYVVRDREGSGSHIWAPGLQGNASCGNDGVLSIARVGGKVTGYCDGREIWSTERKAPLTSLQFVLQNNGTNDPTSVTFRDWGFSASGNGKTSGTRPGAGQQAGAPWGGDEPLVTGTYEGPGIRVRTGNYGHNCGARFGNVTKHLAASCDGRARCDYRIDYTVIGDPVPGCSKDYVAVWKCPDDATWYATNANPEAGFGKIVVLQCPGPGSAQGGSSAAPPDSQPVSVPASAKSVLEDDKGTYRWIENTEVQTQVVHSGRAAFRATGNNHFDSARLGLVGNYAGQYRYLDFWVYLKTPSADIQIQVQVDGSWGKRWGYDGEASYNGYGWAMEGTTPNVPSGRWQHLRLDLINQLHIHPGQAITGLAFSSDGGDVYYDSVYLLPVESPLRPPRVDTSGKKVLEDDAGSYRWVEKTQVQTEVVANGRAAFRSTGNNHFDGADLGLAGDYANQFRKIRFWVYPMGPEADIQLQVQVDGSWGKRWGLEVGPTYNGYGWHMEGTTTGLKSGVWQEVTLDLIDQLHLNPGQRITGLAFSSDGGDVYYDAVYLLPNDRAAPPPRVDTSGKKVLEDDAGSYRWVEKTQVQNEVVANGRAAFRSTGNNHFDSTKLGLVGDYPELFRTLNFWLYPMGPEADIQIQVQVDGAWGKRWGYEAGPAYNGFGWHMEGTTARLKSGQWQAISLDLIDQLHINPGQKITGLAFSSDGGDVYYDAVYLRPHPNPARKSAYQPAGKRVLEDDAGSYIWVEPTEVQEDLVFHGARAFRATGNNHFTADLGVAGSAPGQYRYLNVWAFFMGAEADMQIQVQVNGSWGKRWGYEAGPAYNGFGWHMEGTTARMTSGRWVPIRLDLLSQLKMKPGERITGLAFSSDGGDVYYDSVYLLPDGAAPVNVDDGGGRDYTGGDTGGGGRDYTANLPPPAASGSLRLDKSRFIPGENMVVHFTAPTSWPGNAWIGIIPSNIPHGSEAENDRHDITYQHLNQRGSGSLTFKAPNAGNWDFRLHDTDNNGREVDSVSFQVVQETAPVGGGRDYTGDRGVANLARGKPASQSSRSQWSRPDDPQGAVDGVINGGYAFHTNNEARPWWQVDLGAAYPLGEIRLYNRQDCCGERARTVQVKLSEDGHTWRTVYRHDGTTFGGKSGQPLVVRLAGETARHVRLQLDETTWFHLDEVEVFAAHGAVPDDSGRDYTGSRPAPDGNAPALSDSLDALKGSFKELKGLFGR